MPKGASDIPDLRLVVLKKTIESFMTPPNLYFINRFGQDNNESDTIEWETVQGTRGLTPFAVPGAPAQEGSLEGHGAGRAMAAYWKEKIFFDENFLNNLRQVGTRQVYMPAARQLARAEKSLKSRNDRRKEWTLVKMFSENGFSYLGRGGVKLSVSYGIPSSQRVSLTSDTYWDTGSKKNILQDLLDAHLALKNSVGAVIRNCMFTTEILNILIMDPAIQSLVQKSTFGSGDLFTRPLSVLSALFGIPNMMTYDEQYQVTGWLTAAVTGTSTVDIYVDDTTDFEVGATIRIHDVSERDTYEELTISSITPESGYITVDTAPTNSYKNGEDKITMTKKFLSDKKVLMFADDVEGDSLAEFMNAPYGLSRSYGMKVKRWDVEDPEGSYVMVENKGLPILYRPEGIYTLTVRA